MFLLCLFSLSLSIHSFTDILYLKKNCKLTLSHLNALSSVIVNRKRKENPCRHVCYLFVLSSIYSCSTRVIKYNTIESIVREGKFYSFGQFIRTNKHTLVGYIWEVYIGSSLYVHLFWPNSIGKAYQLYL